METKEHVSFFFLMICTFWGWVTKAENTEMNEEFQDVLVLLQVHEIHFKSMDLEQSLWEVKIGRNSQMQISPSV